MAQRPPHHPSPSRPTDADRASFVSRRTVAAVRAALMTGLVLGGAFSALPAAQAQTAAAAPEARQYNIPAGTLEHALNAFAAASGVEFSADAKLLQGKTSKGLAGSYTVDAGFAELLGGQSLTASRQPNGSYTLNQVLPQHSQANTTTLATVKVSSSAPFSNDPIETYAGGQVARGARLGILGNVDMMDTPFSVTAYTAQTIVDQQSATVSEVLRNDPSVRMTTSDGHNAENITIRGFDVNSSELALNGVYGMLPGAHVPTEFLDRVEVFRGPAAMLSGIAPSGSVGGVINLVPKRATDEPLTRLTTSYTSDSLLGTAADVSRRFGEEKRLGIRVNSSLKYGNSTLEDQTKRENFQSIGMDYRGNGWKVEMDAYSAHQNQANGSPLMVSFSSLGHVTEAPDPTKNALRGTFATQHTEGAMLRGEAQLTDHISAYAGFGQARYTYDGYLNGTRVIVLDDSGKASAATYNQGGYTHGTTGEIGLRGNFTTGIVSHQTVLSANAQQTTTGAASVATSASYTTNLYDPISNPNLAASHGAVVRSADNRYNSLSLSDTLGFYGDLVQLTLGAREQSVRQRMASPKYDKDALTPFLGVVVKPWGPHVSLYANYIEGLSPGVTVGSTYANYGETLAPYKTRQAETGVKWDAGKITNSLALFRIEKPSTISVANTSGLPTLAVDGEQRNRGVEWNVMGQLTPQWRILGGAAYTQGKQVRASTASNDGKKAAGVPEWTVNLGTELDTPWLLQGLSFNARMIYTDAQYLDAANTLEIPSWTRWDAGVKYDTRVAGKPLVLRLAMENLMDEHYWSGRFNDGYATVGAGRTLKLSATVDF
jgi:iron complex outermembrane recepter protein